MSNDPWDNFLDPDILRPRLIQASVFISAFEVLKNAIIDRIVSFFTDHPSMELTRLSPEYENDVLSRNRSELHASLLWLEDMDAITQNDIEGFMRVKACRNSLAHKLPEVMFDNGLPEDFVEVFAEMMRLLRKIEVWWVINYDADLNPELTGKGITQDDVLPGTVAMMQVMIDVALGPDEKARHYLEELKKRRGVE